MKKYTFRRETRLPVPVEDVWDFFSTASNLEKITPPEVKFRTLTDLGGKRIYNGMRISYRLQPLLGIPVSWETEILGVDAPKRFIDKQLKGPYAFWEHTHTFTPIAGGTLMTDDVIYALPMGWLGIFMHSLVVRKKLEQIFDFRTSVIERTFGIYRER